MHELSIALGIVKIAEDEARKAGASKVTNIEIEIGRLSGIELDSLEFVWPAAVRDSILEDAKRTIHQVDGIAKCMDCDHEFPVEHVYDSCPKCESNLKEIIKGKELRVMTLEVD